MHVSADMFSNRVVTIILLPLLSSGSAFLKPFHAFEFHISSNTTTYLRAAHYRGSVSSPWPPFCRVLQCRQRAV